MNLVLKPCQEGSEAILHGEFGAYPPKGIRYALSLTRTELHIQRLVPKPDTDQRTVIRLIDVVGCHTLRSHTVANQSAFFCIFAYPLKKKKVAVGSGRARQRIAKTFQVDGAERYKENQALAEKWAAAIKCLVLGIPISSETGKGCPVLGSIASHLERWQMLSVSMAFLKLYCCGLQVKWVLVCLSVCFFF